MFSTRALGIAGTAAAFLALTPALAASAGGDHELDDHGRDGPVLEGRAVLPAETYAPGPPSGAFFAPQSPINGVTFPTPSQPAIGYSGIVEGRSPGEYLAMPDNGYGNKMNSFDFELRAYYITPDFKTANGGSGSVAIELDDFIAFSDPNDQAGFDIVREGTTERLLTGADFDPESIQRGPNGDLWLGDEFGPWILHFGADGVLLEPPIAMPDGLMSPANPHLNGAPATVNGSRGLEGMAISPNGKTLTFILEGAVVGAADPFSRRIYQYDIGSDTFTRLADYRTEVAGHFVSDVQALDNHRLVVIERDGGRGLTANFRNVYAVDLNRTGADGAVVKTQVVALAAIPDPDLVSLPALHTGDVGLGDPFRVTCESIEAVHVISHARLLFGCDNNFPNTGRNPNLADDSEFIVVKVPGL
jgi:glycerophosphoryl diester phosphodiesterase